LGELRISISDNLHQTLRMLAIKKRKTLKKLVIEILEKGVREIEP
jgi:predicted DNA-binding protein